MIGRISGKLLEKHPPLILVDVNGVGYEIDVPMSTFYVLPGIGESVSLCTHLSIREDAHVLYGFSTFEERKVFRQLLKISGVGPKLALSVLSGLSIAELAGAVQSGESARLVKIPGVGKKTAERLLLELRDKLEGPAILPKGSSGDVLDALVALGYSEKEASSALKMIDPSLSAEEGIRAGLRLLSRGTS
ncbi:MAG TPA: Holliday junction branch migration protein RuvA [Burkholderiales bacterium]|nr:Holliday junction branch migration protein RuvA [Burkholderiales bacterium]